MSLLDDLRTIDRTGRLDSRPALAGLWREGFIWDDDEAGIYRLTLVGRKILDGPEGC